MRQRNRAFLSCAVVAWGLTAAPGGAQADTCQAGSYTVSTGGPSVVGGNTKITYTISGNNAPDHGSTVNFTVTVSGVRSPAPKSVVVKKGNTVKSCEIVGIGDAGTAEVAPVTEIIKEPGSDCAVEFTRDRISGRVLDAQLVSANPDCTLSQTPVENLSLQVNGPFGACTDATCPLGFAKFGEGYVHSGEGSCTTRVIGGRVYSWGAPCP
jgi:hypothetical protein